MDTRLEHGGKIYGGKIFGRLFTTWNFEFIVYFIAEHSELFFIAEYFGVAEYFRAISAKSVSTWSHWSR